MPSDRTFPASEVLSSAWKQRLRRRVLSWYRRHRRDLPWREGRNPYRVWVSEVMLQQTQVATVVPYFQRFVAAFPDVHALAAAQQQEVLRLWEGLGYYRRARQLHEAARQVVEQYDGRLPQGSEQLRSLPGIGKYTAGAILSIALDRREPILEANTVRLLSRLAGVDAPPTAKATTDRLWQIAEQLLPRKNVGDFNQGLMELGARLCAPREPACERCPLSELCVACRTGRQHELPQPGPATRYEQVRQAAVVVCHQRRVLLLRRTEAARWAGLWDFPRFAIKAQGGSKLQKEIVQQVDCMTGLQVEPVEELTTIRHGVTRFRITLHCHLTRCDRISGKTAKLGEHQWRRPTELNDVPLNRTGRQLATLLAERATC